MLSFPRRLSETFHIAVAVRFATVFLKITLMMRGREMEYKDKGFEAVKRAVAELSHVGTADFEPKLAGRNISLSMSPLPANQRKLKYSAENDAVPEDDSSDED